MVYLVTKCHNWTGRIVLGERLVYTFIFQVGNEPTTEGADTESSEFIE
jgi:hypothetical protein